MNGWMIVHHLLCLTNFVVRTFKCSLLQPNERSSGVPTLQDAISSKRYGMTYAQAIKILGGSTKKDYRRAAKRAHPDCGGSSEEFQKVCEAWKVIQQPKSVTWHSVWVNSPTVRTSFYESKGPSTSG